MQTLYIINMFLAPFAPSLPSPVETHVWGGASNKKHTNILTVTTPVKINLHKITETETKTAFKVKHNKPGDHN